MTDELSHYRSLGFALLPLDGKRPTHSKWQTRDLSDLVDDHSGNIGVLTGLRSGGLVDADADCDTARQIARHILPATDMVFGPDGAPHHFMYVVPDSESIVVCNHPGDGRTIIELRGDKHQTVVPPSTNASGQPIRFVSGQPGQPAESTWAELKKHVAIVATAVVVSEHWLPGSRHALAVAFSGFMANQRVDIHNAIGAIKALADIAKDEEIDDRLNAVVSTYQRFAAGMSITGISELERLLGPKATARIQSWFGRPNSLSLNRINGQSEPACILHRMKTEASAAEVFSETVCTSMIYDDANSQWLFRHNDVYGPITHEMAQGIAMQFVMQACLEAGSMADFAITKSLQSQARINSLLALSRSKLRENAELFDRDGWLAGCQNGVIDLATRDLLKPESVVTKRLGTAFDPEAGCPAWLAFLNRIFNGNQEIIAFLRRAVGYTLTGSVSAQCLFLLVGTGANGKSTFLNVLSALFGDYSASTPMHTLMVSKYGSEKTDDLAALKSKRFVTALEGEAGQKLAVAKIKAMTGGDAITARYLYGNLFTFHAQFTLWMGTNDVPVIQGGDEAIWRRVHIVNFPVTIPAAERDGKLVSKLVAELPGILNWALEGLADFERGNGLNPPKEVQASTAAYRSESDTTGQFIETACEQDPEAMLTMRELHEAYSSWCEGSGVEPLSSAKFGKELTRLGYEVVRGREGNGRKGLKLIRPRMNPLI